MECVVTVMRFIQNANIVNRERARNELNTFRNKNTVLEHPTRTQNVERRNRKE